MRRTQIILGVTFLTLLVFSAVPKLGATDSPEADANRNGIGEPFTLDEGFSIKLPFQPSGNLDFGAITESSAQAGRANTEEDRLAQQLANPIPTPIFVPFQANEDFGYGPSHNGYRFTLNIQPIVPISITENWKVFVRTIIPVVSQHDLFYVENLPKSAPINPQNRSQDGLSDTTQSFFFSPKKPGPHHALVFNANPRIKRVVFICAPHRGSDLAISPIAEFGMRLITLSRNIAGAIKNQVGPELAQIKGLQDRPNVCTGLSPDSPALRTMNTVPIQAPYHSIIGNRGLPGPPAGSSDGIVPYWSSHRDRAQSEVIVPGPHGLVNYPQTIAELKRILHLHLKASGTSKPIVAQAVP